MKRDCHEVAVRIERLCREFNIRLETFWISRDSKEIEFCDSWSKQVDKSDYWLDMEDFRRLERRYGPFAVDYFASYRSYRMRPFMARFAAGESMGADAFSVSWRKGVGYFHPPVGLAWKVVRKAEREKARGVLVVLDWPGSGYLLVVEERVRTGKLVLMERLRLVLTCPD